MFLELPCDGHVGEAGAAAAAGPRADPQFVFARALQEGFVATELFQHHNQELEHHDGKIATGNIVKEGNFRAGEVKTKTKGE